MINELKLLVIVYGVIMFLIGMIPEKPVISGLLSFIFTMLTIMAISKMFNQ